jgi:hypothetical protein
MAGNVDATPATRTWTVVPPPVTTIFSGPSALSTVESALFLFAADQAGSTFECSLDEAEFRRCTSPQAYWVVTDGPHKFEVRAINPEGVVEEPPALYEWVAQLGPDELPPDTRILSGPPLVDQSVEATFTFTGSDNRTAAAMLTFECALDGTAYNSCESPQKCEDLTRRLHVMRIRARDAAGNYDPTPAIYEWRVKSPPVTTILSGPAPDGVTESRSARFTFAADVPGSTFWCWMDGVLDQNCTSPKDYTDLGIGPHRFFVLARDPDGIWELDWVDYEWTVGYVTPPLTIIESGPDIESEVLRATFEFSTNGVGTHFECSVDGGEPRVCESPFTVTVGVGAHTFEVYAIHPTHIVNGEEIKPFYDPIVATYEWTAVDHTPPETAIMYGPNEVTASSTASFGFAASEPGAIVQCSLDWQGFGSCENPTVFEDLLPGEHILHARAVDLAGNADPTPETYRWTIERGSPNTPVGSPVKIQLPMPGGGGTATIEFFQVSSAGATYLEALSGGPSIDLIGYGGAGYFDINTTAQYGDPVWICLPYDQDALAGGAARLLEYDGSGWVDVSISNDTVAGRVCGEPEHFGLFALATSTTAEPLVSIISGPERASDSPTATFVFAADLPGAIIQCSFDGLPFTMCESPMTYTHVQTGSHKFEVRAVTWSGQPTSRVPVLYEWEVSLPVDTTPPDTRILRGPPTLTANREVDFVFTGMDDQSLDIDLEFECLLDGVLVGSCSSIPATPTTPCSFSASVRERRERQFDGRRAGSRTA